LVLQQVDSRQRPFPSKVSPDQAQEVRRLRRDGAPLAELSEKFAIAKSSVSAIAHFHAHVPDGAFRVVLPEFEAALPATVHALVRIARARSASP